MSLCTFHCVKERKLLFAVGKNPLVSERSRPLLDHLAIPILNSTLPSLLQQRHVKKLCRMRYRILIRMLRFLGSSPILRSRIKLMLCQSKQLLRTSQSHELSWRPQFRLLLNTGYRCVTQGIKTSPIKVFPLTVVS